MKKVFSSYHIVSSFFIIHPQFIFYYSKNTIYIINYHRQQNCFKNLPDFTNHATPAL